MLCGYKRDMQCSGWLDKKQQAKMKMASWQRRSDVYMLKDGAISCLTIVLGVVSSIDIFAWTSHPPLFSITNLTGTLYALDADISSPNACY